MTSLSTLPSTREQVRRALLLIGGPAPARLIVELHGALFDGDLEMSAVAGVLRDEERDYPGAVPSAYRICPGLNGDLTPARGLVTLSTWPLAQRIAAPERDGLAGIVRIAEYVAMRETAGAAAAALLRRLADDVPGGREGYDVQRPAALADAARSALAATPAVPPAAETEQHWADLDERQQLFGVPAVPRQRSRG